MPIKAIVNGTEKEIARIPVLGHDIETATGTNSVTFNTSSDRVIECDIFGNTQQSRTPAPDAPIMPTFCGKLVGTDWTIPITNAGQTVPVYLGEVPTVRRIKKLVLTGEENYNLQSINAYGIANFYFYISNLLLQYAICTHLKRQTNIISQTTDDGYLIAISTSTQNASFYMRINSATASTVAELKTYLAAQYAAGTPVTVWYILAEPETAIINEPLAKIGNYADELHSEDAGITIPTAKGANTLTVDTTLSPSSTTVTYRGTNAVYKDAWEVRDNQDRLLWYREDTLTGTSSISYKGYGIPLKSMKIVGNGQQNGTPSPDNIIMPEFVGVRTGNLCPMIFSHSGIGDDVGTVATMSTRLWSSKIAVLPSQSYYAMINGEASNHEELLFNRIIQYDANGEFISRISVVNQTEAEITTAENCRFVVLDIRTRTLTVDITMDDITAVMLSAGSQASYEPYGYKIPITNAGQTVPVYLGEVPTVRRIRKMVLTGEENFNTDTYLRFSIFIGDIKTSTSRTGRSYCSHYDCLYHAEPYDNDWNNVYYQSGSTLYFHDRRISAVSDFKAYLAAQYAAGTPITIWYVIAKPETAIVNEPLAKIGDYADELIIDPGITPQTGTNTLTVDTTLSPSSTAITGHIKALS